MANFKDSYQAVITEVGFVRANWGKLSAIVIGVFALGVAFGALVL